MPTVASSRWRRCLPVGSWRRADAEASACADRHPVGVTAFCALGDECGGLRISRVEFDAKRNDAALPKLEDVPAHQPLHGALEPIAAHHFAARRQTSPVEVARES